MDLLRIISDLQSEKQRLDEAIEALERVSIGRNRWESETPPLGKGDSVPAGGNRRDETGIGRDEPSTNDALGHRGSKAGNR